MTTAGIRIVVVAAIACCLVGPLHADHDTKRITQLINALTDPNERLGASRSLAAIGKRAAPILIESLNSDDADCRIWCAYTLGEMGPDAEAAVGLLAKTLDDADAAVRAAAAQALGKIGPVAEPSVEQLARLLSDTKVDVRQAAAVALGRIGPRAAPAAYQLTSALKDDATRPHAKKSLLQIGEAASDALVKSLHDNRIRFDAAAILTQIAPAQAQRAGVDKRTLADLASLRIVLHDATRTLQDKALAADALAELGKEGVAVLINAFEDTSAAETAARAFRKVGPEGLVGLIAALGHEEAAVRRASANAIGHIGPSASSATPQLVKLFGDPDHDVRYRAVRALDAFGEGATPAVDDLTRLMLDPKQREPARLWAIIVLGNTLPATRDQVVKALIQASQDKGNYGVSSLAKSTVKRIDAEAAKAAGLR